MVAQRGVAAPPASRMESQQPARVTNLPINGLKMGVRFLLDLCDVQQNSATILSPLGVQIASLTSAGR